MQGVEGFGSSMGRAWEGCGRRGGEERGLSWTGVDFKGV